MKRCLPLFLILLASAGLYCQEAGRGLRRLALLVGSNTGGRGRTELKYAEKDARTFSQVMRDLGGIDPANEYVLRSPDKKTFLREFSSLKSAAAASRNGAARTEFLFYYSGHSDEEGLLLGNEKIPYADLKDLIRSLGAEVDVVILDSCSSGAITRLKGGSRAQPFLVDESSAMSGHAYLTSSSEFEATQESDKIRGSFFTYYLVAGLRGAADASGDGKITLNEAYSHAFSETLARTEYTQAGPQHPSYNIKLTGSGDLVLTDVRSAETRIIFDEAIKGRLTIRDDRENLVSETLKKADKNMEFYLPYGTYSITLLSGSQLLKTKVTLSENASTRIGIGIFSPIGRDEGVARGSEEEEAEVRIDPYSLAIYSMGKETDELKIGHHFALNMIGGKSYAIRGAQLSLGLGVVTTDVGGAQLTAGVNMVGRDVSGAQLSAGVNIVGRNVVGAQFAGLANVVDGDFTGYQAGPFNIVSGGFTGLQEGVINHSGDLTGVRLGVVNVGENIKGADIGVVNVASEAKGFQLGVVNLDAKSPEVQFGIVNVNKESRGLQLGIVNVSDTNEGWPVGIVSVVLRGGQTHSLSWIDERGYVNTAFVHGSKRSYNVYSLGARVDGGRATADLGLGFSVRSGNFFLNLEGLVGNAYGLDANSRLPDESTELIQRTRLYGGYSFYEHLSVFAGASYNFSFVSRDEDDDLKYSKRWPGFFFGVRF